jgi:hypothetical protein
MVRRNSARRPETGSEDDAWFAAKRYGYGSSLPIAWQGWVVTLAFCISVTLSAIFVLPRSIFAFVTIVLGATAAFILICALKTQGGWRWRWGGDA